MFPEIAVAIVPLAVAALGVGFARSARKQDERHRESHLSDLIPWSHIDRDGGTVVTSESGAFRVYRLSGCIYEGMRNEEVQKIEGLRSSFFFALRETKVQVRIISDRRAFNLPTRAVSSGFLHELDEAWHSRFSNAYTTDHYIILSTGRGVSRTSLDDACVSVETLLGDYRPVQLRNTGLDGTSPLMSFLARHLNYFAVKAPPCTHGLSDRLAFAHITTSRDGDVQYSDGENRIFCSVLSVKTWPSDHLAPSMISRLMMVRAELCLCINVRPYSKVSGMREIVSRSKQARLAFPNELIDEEWRQTEEEHSADRISMCDGEITIFVYGKTREELQCAIEQMRAALGSESIRLTVEKLLADRLFWARLPGFDYYSKPWFFNNNQVSDLIPLSDQPHGNSGCYWGEYPVRYYPTPSGYPYAYTYHGDEGEQSLGHFVVFAPTGKGKTVKTGFDICGALTAYPDVRVYLFDRHLGMRVLVEALGGDYLIPESANLPLNPFLCEASEENIGFLQKFVELLAGIDGSAPTHDEAINAIATGVRDIMGLPKEERSLKKQWNKAFPADSALGVRAALRKWSGSDRFGRIFNADRDTLRLDGPRVVGFDMTAAGDDPRINAALIYYFMRRIRQSLSVRAKNAVGKSTPHIVFIDEAAPSFNDPVFAREAQFLFREHRKLDGVVGASFQEIRALRQCAIAQSIRANTKTYFFWPGTAQDAEDMDFFPFTQDERSFVAAGKSEQVAHMVRPVLMKRQDESVFLETDLSSIGPLIKVFRGGEKPVALMRHYIDKHGVKEWLSHYLMES